MRISDWSSDVCSSDLHFGCAGADLQQLDRAVQAVDFRLPDVAAAAVDLHGVVQHLVQRLCGVHDAGGGQLVDFAASALAFAHRVRGTQILVGVQAPRFDPDVYLGEHRLHNLEGGNRFAEMLALT